MPGPIARPYAEALIEIGEEKGLLDTFRENLEFIAEFLETDRDFHAFFESPRIDRAAKRQVIQKAMAGKLDDMIVSFLELLIEKSRQLHLGEIIEEFTTLYDERKGRVSVQVQTARPIEEEGSRALVERLSRILKKEVRLETELKPELLGGIVLHVEDTVVDGSLKRRLESLSKKMRSASLKGEGIYED